MHFIRPGYCLCFIFTIVVFLGCNGGNSPTGKDSSDPSASLTFQLSFASPSDHEPKAQTVRAIGEPNICQDYLIDTITVNVHRVKDNSEVGAVQGDCIDHSLTVTKVPAAENLYLVCKGLVGGEAVWQGNRDGIVAKAGQDTYVGEITMVYIGADTVAPVSISTFPVADTNDVDLNTWIVVNFNEGLSPGSIPENAVTLMAGENQVEGQINYDPATFSIRFVPAAGLDPQTTYSASLQSQGTSGGMITDIAGHTFTGGVIQWGFSTRGDNDTTAPQVIAASPADGADDVALQSIIMAQFSEPMRPESFTDAVQLSSEEGVVSGQIQYDEQSRTVTFTPEVALTANTLYTAVVSDRVSDGAQNTLLAPVSWQFMAIGPEFSLDVTKAGNGVGTITSMLAGINCGSTCQAEIDLGARVTIEANANENSIFNGWSGDVCEGTSDPCTFTMKADTAITANFSLLTYTITNELVAPAEEAGGAITPGDTTVNHGDHLTFEINSNPFYHLSQLIVDGNTATPTGTYLFENVTANHSIGAVFDKNEAICLFSVPDPNPSNISVHGPKIGAGGHVIWGSAHDIYYWDGSFPPNPMIITNNESIFNTDEQINADGHIIWTSSNSAGGGLEINYWDGSFPPNPVNISNNADGDDRYPQINADGHVVWQREIGTDKEIYYWDGSFPPVPINISNNSLGVDVYPQISADDQVVWRSDNGTDVAVYYWDGSFPPKPVIITSNHSYDPKINAVGQVVWQRYLGSGAGYDIFYWDGSFPPAPVDISHLTQGDDRNPQINAEGHVVWQSDDGSDKEIYYWDGSFPPAPVNISNNAIVNDYAPKINATGQVVWTGNDGSDYGSYFYDGSRLTKAIKISANHSGGPYINMAGHMVWLKNDENSVGKEIFLNCEEQCSR